MCVVSWGKKISTASKKIIFWISGFRVVGKYDESVALSDARREDPSSLTGVEKTLEMRVPSLLMGNVDAHDARLN